MTVFILKLISPAWLTVKIDMSFLTLFRLSLLLLLLRLNQALVCYSTNCTDPDDHGFCEQTCHAYQACLWVFLINPNHTATAGVFQCHTVSDQECLATTCQIEQTAASLDVCCCRTDYCNLVPGLFGSLTPAPPVILPTPPVPPLSMNQLVCEFNNCTLSASNTNCYHSYEICEEHLAAEGTPPDNHYCAVHAVRAHNGLYELQSKGCVITADESIVKRGRGQSQCVLNTTNASNNTACYCDSPYCNNVNGLSITDPGRFIGADPDVLCDGLGCSHSCVIADNVPRCLCPVGYALDHKDLQTCIGV